MATNHNPNAVLLLAHGSPDDLAGMADFLRNVTGGRPMPADTVEEFRHRYAQIGGSPLNRITARQAELLAAELKLPVYFAMRNWTPYIPDVVRRMEADGVQRAVAICLAPQNSRTSVGLYRRALFGEGAGESQFPPAGHKPAFAIDFVESWHDHPLLVQAFAERLLDAWCPASARHGGLLPVIFTAHSVPARTIAAGDPYEAQARETAKLVAAAVPTLGDGDWRFAFQSQGLAGGQWLGPTVEETILELRSAGHRGVFIQPIGFLCDHVEVLYDIDIVFTQFAAQHGMQLWRAQSLNESPTLISALASVARARMKPATAGKAP
jgi:ferrochelatase